MDGDIGLGFDVLEELAQAARDLGELFSRQGTAKNQGDVGITTGCLERPPQPFITHRRADEQNQLALLRQGQRPALQLLLTSDRLRLIGKIAQQWIAAALLAENVRGFANRVEIFR